MSTTPELTTGCACRDLPRWYPGRPAHPACPVHGHQLPASPPCSCHYGLHPTTWCPTHLIDVPGIGQRGAAYTFRINPWCPHHGAEDEFGRMPAAELVLDEDERRGH